MYLKKKIFITVNKKTCVVNLLHYLIQLNHYSVNWITLYTNYKNMILFSKLLMLKKLSERNERSFHSSMSNSFNSSSRPSRSSSRKRFSFIGTAVPFEVEVSVVEDVWFTSRSVVAIVPVSSAYKKIINLLSGWVRRIGIRAYFLSFHCK